MLGFGCWYQIECKILKFLCKQRVQLQMLHAQPYQEKLVGLGPSGLGLECTTKPPTPSSIGKTCHDSVVDASQLELRLGFTLLTYLGNRNWTNHLGQLGIELNINEKVFLVDRPSIPPHGALSIVGSIRLMIRVVRHSGIQDLPLIWRSFS